MTQEQCARTPWTSSMAVQDDMTAEGRRHKMKDDMAEVTSRRC